MSTHENVIQVAGIHDFGEAQLAIEAGANWLGFPLRLPSGNDDLTEDQAKKIIERLPQQVTTVLITYMTSAAEIDELVRYVGFDAVQIHGDIQQNELSKLRKLNPDIQILKSLVVGKEPIENLLLLQSEMEPYVDMFLTDTFNPQNGAMGATGIKHDWNDSKRIVQNTKLPVIIAGGLTPDNVYDAVCQIQPFGVDAHTGLEDAQTKYKTFEKVSQFSSNARKAFEQI